MCLSLIGGPRSLLKLFSFLNGPEVAQWKNIPDIWHLLKLTLVHGKRPAKLEKERCFLAFYYNLSCSDLFIIIWSCSRRILGVTLQFEYNDWLTSQCGCPADEEWRKEMFYSSVKNLFARPESYRDEWEDHHLLLQAHEDFIQYTSNCVSNRCLPQ